MKKLTQKQIDEVKSLEESGDSLLAKNTFDKCMDAIDVFIKAQELLVKYASDKNAASQYGELKSEDMDCKVWYAKLITKMENAQKMLSSSKAFRK